MACSVSALGGASMQRAGVFRALPSRAHGGHWGGGGGGRRVLTNATNPLLSVKSEREFRASLAKVRKMLDSTFAGKTSGEDAGVNEANNVVAKQTAPELSVGKPTLYSGCNQRFMLAVDEVQKLLQKHGYFPGEDDLYHRQFSDGTEEAVKCFQASQGLPETGAVDDITWARLLEAKASPAAIDKFMGVKGVRRRGEVELPVVDVSETRREIRAMALEAFWLQQGLQPAQAGRLVEGWEGDCDVEFLESKMQRLRCLLPGVPVEQAVLKHVDLLRVDPEESAKRVTRLMALFPGVSVAELCAADPRILTCRNFSLVEKGAAGLQVLFPNAADVAASVAESPEVILRLGHYDVTSAADFSRLPMELQNQLVVGGGGGGGVYRSWSGFTDNNTD